MPWRHWGCSLLQWRSSRSCREHLGLWGAVLGVQVQSDRGGGTESTRLGLWIRFMVSLVLVLGLLDWACSLGFGWFVLGSWYVFGNLVLFWAVGHLDFVGVEFGQLESM